MVASQTDCAFFCNGGKAQCFTMTICRENFEYTQRTLRDVKEEGFLHALTMFSLLLKKNFINYFERCLLEYQEILQRFLKHSFQAN